MSANSLRSKLNEIYPPVEMPPVSELFFHQDFCFECKYLYKDLEKFRKQEITDEVILLVYQDMHHFSAKAWRWILPQYIKFCLSDAAKQPGGEAEFLIYQLGPDLQCQKETLQRLSALTHAQILFLIHFLEWCLHDEYWQEYCLNEIIAGINFLRSI